MDTVDQIRHQQGPRGTARTNHRCGRIHVEAPMAAVGSLLEPSAVIGEGRGEAMVPAEPM